MANETSYFQMLAMQPKALRHPDKLETSHNNSTQTIAFSVRLENDAYLYAGDVVPFNDVIANEGGHYSSDNHTFTCPRRGMFVFSMRITSFAYSYAGADMVRNDVLLASALANGEVWTDSSSTTVVTECDEGDAVHVKVWCSGTFEGFLAPCTFTGFLLNPI